jgi:hypothetical protein
LEGGQFLAVRPVLMKRQKSSFHTLPCGVDVILGINGYIWLCPPKDVPSTVCPLAPPFPCFVVNPGLMMMPLHATGDGRCRA